MNIQLFRRKGKVTYIFPAQSVEGQALHKVLVPKIILKTLIIAGALVSTTEMVTGYTTFVLEYKRGRMVDY